MKMEKKLVIRKACVAVGICLLAGAALTLGLWQWNIHRATTRAAEYVHVLQQSTPTPQNAVLESRRDNAMAAFSVDGVDFVGVLEMPQYASVMPVGATWGRAAQYPCRFDGSVYDGTLQIGATTQRGQYDFYRELSVGDTVIYTDMEGNRYTFAIRSLRTEKHADQATLQRESAPLTLFIKNVYAFEYLIVYCDVR